MFELENHKFYISIVSWLDITNVNGFEKPLLNVYLMDLPFIFKSPF